MSVLSCPALKMADPVIGERDRCVVDAAFQRVRQTIDPLLSVARKGGMDVEEMLKSARTRYESSYVTGRLTDQSLVLGVATDVAGEIGYRTVLDPISQTLSFYQDF